MTSKPDLDPDNAPFPAPPARPAPPALLALAAQPAPPARPALDAGPLLPAGDDLEALAARAALYATRAHGAGTRRAYRSAWRGFSMWCRSLGRDPLAGDADTIAMYVVRRADDGLAVASIRVALAAIRAAHRMAGIPLDLGQPRFTLVLEGVVRSRGTRPSRQAAPAVPAILRQMLDALPGPGFSDSPGKHPDPTSLQPLAVRNRAMLLLGFGAALRRSELVALTLGDVETVPGRGLRLLVRRSKTDPHGKGQEIAIWANPAEPLVCPAAAFDAWRRLRERAADVVDAAAAERGERTLFCGLTKSGGLTGRALSDKAVARLVKQAAADAGLDATRYSGHSLRAGLATAAGDQGAGLAELMRQTRHRSTEIALGYLRPADLWRRNVTEGLLAPAVRPERDPC